MRYLKLFFVAVSFAVASYAEDHQVVFDYYGSPYMGAENMLTVHHELDKGEAAIFNRDHPFNSNWANILFRFVDMELVWVPVNYLFMVVQHEVFGHGFRIRTLHDYYAKVTKYSIGVPIPYGHGGGSTKYVINYNHFTLSQDLMVSSAGVESTAVFANRIRLHWLADQKINPRETSLYLQSIHDITRYVYTLMLSKFDNDSGHDIKSYVDTLNYAYPMTYLSVHSLRNKACINWLDPFTFFSIYAAWKYIFTGKDTSIPMIPIGNAKYLPAVRMALSPFGPEFYLDNFLIYDSHGPMYFYFRGGHHGPNRYYGMGCEKESCWKNDSQSIGFTFDAWLQPEVLQWSYAEIWDNYLYYERRKGKNLGGSFSIICQHLLIKKVPVFLRLQMGWKTKGFLMGEPYQGSPIFRLGITGSF